jgi:transcriptional repressor NrdR
VPASPILNLLSRRAANFTRIKPPKYTSIAMKCPYCSSLDTRVINSRPADENTAIRRRRECAACNRRFTTYERAQFEALMVVKRSGRREAFDPDKLLGKLRIACNKRPVAEKQLREFAYAFEDEVQLPEISSEEIGVRALRFLRSLDDVAYIRFLSVYRDFDSVDRFIDEIRQLGDVSQREKGRP